MRRFDEPVKIAEGEYLEYWRNWQCESIEQMCAEYDAQGLSLGPCKAFLTVDKKTGHREYIVFDPDGMPIIAARDLETVDMKIHVQRYLLREKLDIRTMAETREVPKVI